MTDTNLIDPTNPPIKPLIPEHPENSDTLSPETQNISETSNTLFQPAKQMEETAQETIKSWTELLWGLSQIWTNIVQSAGEMMAEPSNLFQPTKAVSSLGNFAKNLGTASIEGAKDIASNTVDLATNVVGDISNIWKDITNIRVDPKPVGEWLFQPKKPLEDLSSIGTKVIKSWVAIVWGTVSTGANVAKNIVKSGTNLLKKWLWILWKKDEE